MVRSQYMYMYIHACMHSVHNWLQKVTQVTNNKNNVPSSWSTVRCRLLLMMFAEWSDSGPVSESPVSESGVTSVLPECSPYSEGPASGGAPVGITGCISAVSVLRRLSTGFVESTSVSESGSASVPSVVCCSSISTALESSCCVRTRSLLPSIFSNAKRAELVSPVKEENS